MFNTDRFSVTGLPLKSSQNAPKLSCHRRNTTGLLKELAEKSVAANGRALEGVFNAKASTHSSKRHLQHLSKFASFNNPDIHTSRYVLFNLQ